MSEQAVEGVQGQGQNDGGNISPTATGTDNASNPMYADYLSRVPEGVRPIVEPVFKEWDAGVTKRFQELHSQYEPWSGIVDEYEPEGVQQAIALMRAVEADPHGVYEALRESLGDAITENTTDPDDENAADYDEEDPYEARFRKQEEMLGTIAEILLGQRDEVSQNQEDQELDQYLSSLKEKYGDFDEDYVLTKMANGTDGEKAIQQYQSLIDSRAASRNQAGNSAPVVLGAGGGLPSNQVDPSKLDDRATKDLVAQMLAAARES